MCHVSSDTFRDLWGNLKFYQKGIFAEHNIHLKNSMVDSGRKRTKAWSWACETQNSLCCERNWNSLGVCVHAAVFTSTLSATFLLSFGGKPWPLPLMTSDPAEIHTPSAGVSFGSMAPICKAFRVVSQEPRYRQSPFPLPSSHLQL